MMNKQDAPCGSTFKIRTVTLQKQCFNDLNRLKAMSCDRKGTHPGLVVRIYKGLIRPKLHYGCSLYGLISHTTL